jgi:MFS transporter, FHS family, L-fucose permease
MIAPINPMKTDAKPARLFRTADGKNHLFTFLLLCSLFLLWGCCSGLLDNLNKHFQNTLHLSKFQSGFVQWAFYMGYCLIALPAGMISRRFGYKGGIIVGLTLAALGAFWFVPATNINTYWAFLLGLFVLACGLGCLETNANPYTTVLGPAESGATRINMAQTCNGFGWISGMFIGSTIILSATQEVNTSNAKLYIPYMGIGIAVAVLLVIFIFAKVPDVPAAEEFKAEAEGKATKSIFKRSHFTLGVVAQFLYVAAQTGIFSFFVNYVRANVADSTDRSAGYLQTLAFVCFAGGRFFGSGVVGLTKPHKALAGYAAVNTIMMVVAMAGGGWAGVIGVMASFFFMSIMFPTIFALSIKNLGVYTKLGSSLLVMSIIGGAIVPAIMGFLSDHTSIQAAFAVPLFCYAVVVYFSFIGYKPPLAATEE